AIADEARASHRAPHHHRERRPLEQRDDGPRHRAADGQPERQTSRHYQGDGAAEEEGLKEQAPHGGSSVDTFSIISVPNSARCWTLKGARMTGGHHRDDRKHQYRSTAHAT